MPTSNEFPVLSLDQRSMSAQEQSHLDPLSWQRIYNESKDAVVQVCGGNKDASTCGSGFFVNESGVLATDLHVIEGLKDIEITTVNGRKLHAQELGRDAKSGLALLKLTDARPNERFHALSLASTLSLNGGEDVAALGFVDATQHEFLSPGRFRSKAQMDHIRPILKQQPDGEIKGTQLFLINQMLTKKGNSGGPVLDRQGKVLGMIRYTDSTKFSFATRVEELSELINAKKIGQKTPFN